MKHKKYIVAGDNNNGRLYHEDANGRENAQWKINPIVNNYSSTTHLIDKRFGKAIVTGNELDKYVYHQPDHERTNARWSLILNCFPWESEN